MKYAKRQLTFKFEYESKFGEVVQLETVYKVEFRRYDDSAYTHITVCPDFGPEKKLKVMDCGITWKSLLRAYEYCSSHAKGHIDTWFEMDTQEDVDAETPLSSGCGVIPEQKLSTSKERAV